MPPHAFSNFFSAGQVDCVFVVPDERTSCVLDALIDGADIGTAGVAISSSAAIALTPAQQDKCAGDCAHRPDSKEMLRPSAITIKNCQIVY